jgi:hypothetical protein
MLNFIIPKIAPAVQLRLNHAGLSTLGPNEELERNHAGAGIGDSHNLAVGE